MLSTVVAISHAGPPSDAADILAPFPNPSGAARSFSVNGASSKNAFFLRLGTNGRACVTCHQPADGWSIVPAHVQARFESSAGLDPIFRAHDGANSPTAAVSTVAARRLAYSMLLSKGLIRVALPIPPNAEFTLVAVDDPYGYAHSGALSLFRRPLPATNLRFLSAVMWDGREMVSGQSILMNLMGQANTATLLHAQAIQPLTAEQRQQIVDFEIGLYTTQVFDTAAGPLAASGASGHPQMLAKQVFYIGINDPFGLNPTGAAFNPAAFNTYSAWASLKGADRYTAARQAVARGQALFNTRRFSITGVKGLNDELGRMSISGTCTTCHNSPNVGNHSVPAPLDIGIADAARRTPDLPLYTLRCTATGELVKTTDPGRALITGKCKDIGRFKGPILRGLAARAPYFHNGSAGTLVDVASFYNQRFQIGLTVDEIADLVAFLRVL
jgi:cytochrome c peroxidase